MNTKYRRVNSYDTTVATILPSLREVKKRAFLRYLQCIDAGFSAEEAIMISNEILTDAGLAPVPGDFERAAK